MAMGQEGSSNGYLLGGCIGIISPPPCTSAKQFCATFGWNESLARCFASGRPAESAGRPAQSPSLPCWTTHKTMRGGVPGTPALRGLKRCPPRALDHAGRGEYRTMEFFLSTNDNPPV